MSYYRTYYDAYEQERLNEETAEEQEALQSLSMAPQIGSYQAMNLAKSILESTSVKAKGNDYRGKCFLIGQDLYESIGMELSVPLYGANGIGRAASLDTIDVPLNNAPYLLQQFDIIYNISTESQRLDAIALLVNWTNPGPGGFYDNLGTSNQPHLVNGLGPKRDPSYYSSPLSAFQEPFNVTTVPILPLSWYSWADTLYDTPLNMSYPYVSKTATYTLKVVFGYEVNTTLKLIANDKYLVHDYIWKPEPPQPLYFTVPKEATQMGYLNLSWSNVPGIGGNGRGCSVSEVWLIAD